MWPIGTFALLAWAGHGFAAWAVANYAWDGFLTSIPLDLIWQVLLLWWLWKEYFPCKSIIPVSRRPRNIGRHPFHAGYAAAWDSHTHRWHVSHGQPSTGRKR